MYPGPCTLDLGLGTLCPVSGHCTRYRVPRTLDPLLLSCPQGQSPQPSEGMVTK